MDKSNESQSPARVIMEDAKRIALFSKTEKWASIIGMIFIFAFYITILFLPNEHGGPNYSHPFELVMCISAMLILGGLMAFFLRDLLNRNETFLVWNGKGIALESHGKTVWHVPWSEYEGLVLNKPNSFFKSITAIQAKGRNKALEIPSALSTHAITRLLLLASPNQLQTLKNLWQPPKPINRKRALILLIVGLAITAIGLPGLVHAVAINHGNSSSSVSPYEFALSALSLLSGITMSFLGIMDVTRRSPQKTTDFSQFIAKWNLADTLLYGDIPGAPEKDAVFEHQADANRRLNNSKIMCFSYVGLAFGISIVVLLGSLSDKNPGVMLVLELIVQSLLLSSAIYLFINGLSYQKSKRFTSLKVAVDGESVRVIYPDDREVSVVIKNPKDLLSSGQSNLLQLHFQAGMDRITICPSLLSPCAKDRL
jgi:hypothetical protein